MVEIVFEAEPLPETRAAILEGLIAFNQQQTEGTQSPPRNVALALRDPETRAAIGGLTARIGYSRMFVELLYVPDRLRGQRLSRCSMPRNATTASSDIHRSSGRASLCP